MPALSTNTIEPPAVAPITLHLIDDDASIRGTSAEFLKALVPQILEHPDVDHFLATFRDDEPAVLITDVRLPGSISGLELLTRLTRRAPHVPVIVITGFADVEMAVDAMRTGAYAFLQKPFRPQQMWETTARSLEESRSRWESAERSRILRHVLRNLRFEDRMVMLYVFEGKTIKEISGRLDLSRRSIDLAKRRILEAFGSTCFIELRGRMAEAGISVEELAMGSSTARSSSEPRSSADSVYPVEGRLA